MSAKVHDCLTVKELMKPTGYVCDEKLADKCLCELSDEYAIYQEDLSTAKSVATLPAYLKWDKSTLTLSVTKELDSDVSIWVEGIAGTTEVCESLDNSTKELTLAEGTDYFQITVLKVVKKDNKSIGNVVGFFNDAVESINL